MKQAEQRARNMLFNDQTTYRTDYKNIVIHEYPKTVYQPRYSRDRRAPATLKYPLSLTEWRDNKPPFNTFHVVKDIIRTHPSSVQQPYQKIGDENREEAQKTRPRVVMTPAVSLDDIEDPTARNNIISDIYTTENTRNLKMAVSSFTGSGTKAPLPGRPAPANPFVLPKLQPPYVSPEWRMESVSWDIQQLRSYCDPTKQFWLEQELPKCKMCEDTTVVHAHRKMLRDLAQHNI